MCCRQREEAREGARRAVEAAGRAGAVAQAAARQQVTAASARLMPHLLFSIMSILYIFSIRLPLLVTLLIFYTSNDSFVSIIILYIPVPRAAFRWSRWREPIRWGSGGIRENNDFFNEINSLQTIPFARFTIFN